MPLENALCRGFLTFKNLFIDSRFRETSICCSAHPCIHWSTPAPPRDPTATSEYQQDAPPSGATQPGPGFPIMALKQRGFGGQGNAAGSGDTDFSYFCEFWRGWEESMAQPAPPPPYLRAQNSPTCSSPAGCNSTHVHEVAPLTCFSKTLPGKMASRVVPFAKSLYGFPGVSGGSG